MDDVFASIKEHAIPELWVMLGLPGEPRHHGAMRSPFREDRTPSFSLFAEGRAWKDHATGDGGDAIEFARHALATDHAGLRAWWIERHGIAPVNDRPPRKLPPSRKPAPPPRAAIEWPAELLPGNAATWHAFAERRGLPFTAIALAVRHGLLRFCRIGGQACYVVTDPARRCAEIRRCDGTWFTPRQKPYGLRGIDKSWLPGTALLEGEPRETSIILLEGCTDFLSALGLYVTYRKNGGTACWRPLALLGAACTRLAPDAAALIRGRHVRIVADADAAGDRMLAHWTALLRGLGCTVDSVTLPRGTDLTDQYAAISPQQLFSRPQ